jgi:PAS domain S-box-containing protein
MNHASIEARPARGHWKSQLPDARSAIQGYGLAVLSVSVALGVSLLMQRYKFRAEFTPFLLAIAITVWYAGTGPSVLALVLSSLAFDYFFTFPLHSLSVAPSEIPYYIIFILFAALVTWFSAVRRRVERDLLRSRDELEREVAERTQQASLLNLTHDTIFVRDMNDIITYWNRGARELYGWTAEEAIGKHTHQLLKTDFPLPIDEVRAELLRAGRWDGELQKTKADGTRVVVASRWSLRRDQQGRPAAILETNNDIT